MVSHTQPVSLKHYPRIQRQPELPIATIPDAHHGAVRLGDDFGLLQQADTSGSADIKAAFTGLSDAGWLTHATLAAVDFGYPQRFPLYGVLAIRGPRRAAEPARPVAGRLRQPGFAQVMEDQQARAIASPRLKINCQNGLWFLP
jgi:hypothetical protein